MYCKNCGKEIVDSSAFCSQCGKKVDGAPTKKEKSNSSNIKKHFRWGIAIIAILTVVVIGVKVFPASKTSASVEQIQTIANNSQNGAVVASDGTWIFYNDNGLCKMKLNDGTKQSVISRDINPQDMFYIGGNLYYYSFPGYYKLDGSDGKDLGFSVFTENCIQSDGKMFYVTGSENYADGGVYAAKVGNTEKGTKLSDIHPTRLLLQGDYLYIISGFGSINNETNENYGTWRIKTNGKDEMSIFEYCPDYLVFSGDKMYYTNEDKVVCSANLDGSDESILADIVVNGGLNVSDEYIFFINNETQTISRMNKDGGELRELNNEQSASLNVVGDWIFYKNWDADYETYKMSFDGSYNQPVYAEQK